MMISCGDPDVMLTAAAVRGQHLTLSVRFFLS